MHKKVKNILSFMSTSFMYESILCRLIASWCSFALLNSFGKNLFLLSYGQEISFASIIFTTLLFFILYSAVNILLKDLPSDSWFLTLAATLCFFRWLFVYDNERNKPLFLLAIIVAYTFIIIYFVNKNGHLFQKWQPSKWQLITLSAIAGLFSVGIISAITCIRYLSFYSPNFDFGLFVNMFHNMRETGLPLVSSERDVILSHFVVHISPVYYFLLPFYAVFPSPLTLQIGQAVVLGSGIIPVFLLCRHFKLSGKCTVLVNVLYAIYPAISCGCFYDIHENCFLTPLLLWTFYFFEKEKYLFMYLFAFLTLTVKEDAAIYVILFALFVLLSKKKYLHGSILTVGALTYFIGALIILNVSSDYYAQLYASETANPEIAGPMINRFDNLIFNKEDGLLGAVKTALVNPAYLFSQLFTTQNVSWEKITYVLQLLLPLGLIPLCVKKHSHLILLSPLLMNLLTYYTYQYDIGFQYHFGISAFLFYAFIMNINDLKPPTRKALLSLAAAACLCMYTAYVLTTLNVYANNWKEKKDEYAEMHKILETVPKDASVVASTFLIPKLADRNEIYELDYHGNETDVDYVIFDARYSVNEAQCDAYLENGYKIKEVHIGKLIILEKEK